MADSLLIIEDEQLLGSELRRYFQRGGWDVVHVKTLADARDYLFSQKIEPLVVISDLNMPDGNGLDFLDECRDKKNPSEWIFLTAYGSVPESVRALRLGAFDFLEKPCDLERLNLIVAGARRGAHAQRRLKEESDAQTSKYSIQSFIGKSPTAEGVREMLAKLASVPFSALIISGETGTGKGLAARIIHHSGNRADGPLVEINCAALPRELLESELFGHEPGAFTGAKARRRGLFEQANGGTLFLDEIGEMEPELQSKLLKVIEDRCLRRLGGEQEIKVDVQIIVASNLDLPKQVEKGRFRADLYHRLSVFQLHLPTLAERKSDLEDLLPAIINEYNTKARKTVKVVPQAIWSKLIEHNWPGNVRELRNVVERCVLFSTNEQFPAQWLMLNTAEAEKTSVASINQQGVYIPLDGSMALDDIDRFVIETTLTKCKFNVTAAARQLNTTRETLRYRVQKYHLMEKQM